MWGEMAGVVRHFGGSEMEIWCSESFLEYVKVISKRTPGNGIYRVSTGHFLLPGRTSSVVGLVYIKLGCLAKGSMEFPNNPSFVKQRLAL